MLATFVDAQKTPYTFEAAMEALKWAMNDPAIPVLALGAAKCALETARWETIWNHNWGNVKAAADYEGMFTCIVLNERLLNKTTGKMEYVWFAPEGRLTASPKLGGKLVGKPLPVPPGHAQTRMRAFANRFDGADQYVRFVAEKYPTSWRALLTGDPYAYVHALKAGGYFTAEEGPYATGVASLQREFTRRLNGFAPDPKVEDSLDWDALRALVAHSQFDLTRPDLDDEDPPVV